MAHPIRDGFDVNTVRDTPLAETMPQIMGPDINALPANQTVLFSLVRPFSLKLQIMVIFVRML